MALSLLPLGVLSPERIEIANQMLSGSLSNHILWVT
jgi:hypothetical protein